MFPDAFPVNEGEELVRRGIVPPPMIRQGPSLRMGDLTSADNRVGSPLDQIGRNAVEDVPAINAQTPIRITEVGPRESLDTNETAPPVGPRMQTSIPYAPPTMPDHSKDSPRGFWGNVGHRLEHAGKGLLLGGPGGAILGAISPRMVDRTEYEQRTLPQYNEQWKMQQGAMDAGIENRARMGGMTGIDPETGQPTETARHRMAIEKETAERNRAVNEDRDLTRRNSEVAMAIRAQAEWDLRHPGELYPEHVTRALPNLAGERAPKVLPKKAFVTTKMGEDGVEYGLTPEGQWEPTATVGGALFKPGYKPERTELTPGEKQAQTRFEQNERQQQQVRYETIQRELGRVKAEREKRAGARNAKGEFTASAEELAALDAQIADLEGQAKANNPAKMAKRAAKQGARSSGPKVGDVVTVGGKQVKIGKIYPDGSFDPE